MVSLFLPAACGGDDDSSASGPSVERYCALSKQLEAIEDDSEDVETEDQLAMAMDKFLEANDGLIDDMRAAAPDEISAELEKAFEALEKMGKGDFAAMDGVDTKKIDDFNAENCK
jgi:hypothetical protein